MKYHTCVVQNFFDDPDSIVKYANKLEWYEPNKDENWPGKRTKNLWEINTKLYHTIVDKILSLYFDLSVCEVTWESSEVKFHKLKYSEWLKHNKKDTRFHKDISDLASVIYLNKDVCDENNGTSFFDDNNNLMFKTSNYYNNAAVYDGSNLLHGCTNIIKKDRLILCVFLNKLKIKK